MICVNTYGSFYCQCKMPSYETQVAKRCLSKFLLEFLKYLSIIWRLLFKGDQETVGINTNCEIINQIMVCNCDKGFEVQPQNLTSFQICQGWRILFETKFAENYILIQLKL